MIEDTIIRPNSNRAKWRITAFLLILSLLVEIWFLIHDYPFFKNYLSRYFKQRTTEGGTAVAELMLKKNSVRVQAPNELIWEDTVTQQKLLQSSSILTLERSRAEIAFLDGTGIIMDENSMIQLEQSNLSDGSGPKKITLKLLRGGIKMKKRSAQLDSSQPFELGIQVNQDLIQAYKYSEFNIEKSESGAKVSVTDGTVEIITQSGKYQLKENEEGILRQEKNKTTQLQTRKLIFLLISPSQGEIFEGADNLEQIKITFSWDVLNSSTGDSPLVLEASPDPQFGSDLHQINIGASEPPLKHVQAALNLPIKEKSKLWYWRIRSLNHPAFVSAVSRIWIQPAQKPILVFPLESTHMIVKEPVDFVWKAMPLVASYEIETSSQTKTTTQESMIRLTHLEIGQYTWRVRAKFLDGKWSSWSETRKIFIDPKGPPPPTRIYPPEVIREK